MRATPRSANVGHFSNCRRTTRHSLELNRSDQDKLSTGTIYELLVDNHIINFRKIEIPSQSTLSTRSHAHGKLHLLCLLRSQLSIPEYRRSIDSRPTRCTCHRNNHKRRSDSKVPSAHPHIRLPWPMSQLHRQTEPRCLPRGRSL